MKFLEMKLKNKDIQEAKLNGKILYTKKQSLGITLTNIIVNSDYSNGTTGFSGFVNCTILGIENSWLKYEKKTLTNNSITILCSFSEELVSGKKYYARGTFNVDIEEGVRYMPNFQLNAPNITIQGERLNTGEQQTHSAIFNTTEQYRLFCNNSSDTDNLETCFYLKELMFIDVTELYNKLGFTTDGEIKNYMDKVGYFNDIYEI